MHNRCGIVLSLCEDLVESKLGRGLHEERTERQRDDLWSPVSMSPSEPSGNKP